MKSIQLIALDLDGTLFDNHSRISAQNFEAIQRVSRQGVHVVLSTGRPYSGLPFEELEDSGIAYAITTNGSSIYEIEPENCLYEDAMDEEIMLPILDFLFTKDIHMDAFIDGSAYSPLHCLAAAMKLDLPDSIKDYILNTRIRVADLPRYIKKHHCPVQKMTLNFMPDGHGGFIDRQEVLHFLEANPNIDVVSGGYNNLEFTRAGINKGVGLQQLARILGIDPDCTMAIGDSENDLSILCAAGVGVAMGNATDQLKQHADYITASNEESGVAQAIDYFIPAATD
jgi:hypothetical protein